MAGGEFKVRFWGVRGSYPVPGEHTVRYGGNTSCVEIRANGHLIVLDAGTGIIHLGQHLMKETERDGNLEKRRPLVTNLLISHTHHDHLQGLPFFAPANRPTNTLNVFGPRSFSQELSQILSSTMEPHYSPLELDELHSKLNIHNLNENQLLVFNDELSEPHVYSPDQKVKDVGKAVVVSLMRSYAHPKVSVFVFRLEFNGKALVYATDTEGYVGGDARLIEFAKDADLLIHDAQFSAEEYLNPSSPKQGFGHSTFQMAVEVAEAAQAKRLVLFHHDPLHDDDAIAAIEDEARQLFPNTNAAAEGFELSL